MLRTLVALVLLAFATHSFALDARKNGKLKHIAPADKTVQNAVSRINQQYQGRVLSATPVKGEQGATRIRVKFLSKDGVIKILFVDPPED